MRFAALLAALVVPVALSPARSTHPVTVPGLECASRSGVTIVKDNGVELRNLCDMWIKEENKDG